MNKTLRKVIQSKGQKFLDDDEHNGNRLCSNNININQYPSDSVPSMAQSQSEFDTGNEVSVLDFLNIPTEDYEFFVSSWPLSWSWIAVLMVAVRSSGGMRVYPHRLFSYLIRCNCFGLFIFDDNPSVSGSASLHPRETEWNSTRASVHLRTATEMHESESSSDCYYDHLPTYTHLNP